MMMMIQEVNFAYPGQSKCIMESEVSLQQLECAIVVRWFFVTKAPCISKFRHCLPLLSTLPDALKHVAIEALWLID